MTQKINFNISVEQMRGVLSQISEVQKFYLNSVPLHAEFKQVLKARANLSEPSYVNNFVMRDLALKKPAYFSRNFHNYTRFGMLCALSDSIPR